MKQLTSIIWVVLLLTLLLVDFLNAEEAENNIYHSFTLDVGVGDSKNTTSFIDWDFDGWIGTDKNKVWLKSNGDYTDELVDAEYWLMYSRNIDTFWDLQVGFRYDEPSSLGYAVIGINGISPYFFETELHLFISKDNDFSLRLSEQKEFFITQKLRLIPYFELNVFFQDVKELESNAGFTVTEVGVKTNYKISNALSGYVNLKYIANLSSISQEEEEFQGILGIQILF